MSAVVFSNAGTISKFNRMGHQGRYRADDVQLLRAGVCFNPDPNSVMPHRFFYEVGDGTHVETWGEELEVFLNPNARFPLPLNVFRDLYHITRDERGVVHALYKDSILFHPMVSQTITLHLTDDPNDTASPSGD